VTADPSKLTSQRGRDAVFTLTVTSKGEPFTDPVSFGCSNWSPFAPGVCRFDPPAVIPGERGATTRMIVPVSTPTGYNGIVYAKSGAIQHSINVQLIVP